MKTAKKRVTDMTVGNPTKHILLFMLPLFLGNMFQQLYNMIDSLVVGNYVGADALAAIGTCGSLNFLFFSLSAGLANGIGVIISQYFGAKDEVNLRNTIANAAYVLVAASVLTTTLGITLAKPLLMLLATPAEILPYSVLYLRVTCCGIIFIALYNGVAGVLRALGDSKTPLYFLIFSSFLNIVLDLTFVLYLKMGVFGVGFATIISQAISAIVSLTYAIIKVPYFRLTKNELKPHKEIIVRSFKLGVPMALQSSMIAISMMVLQGVVNSFGAVAMAAYTISCKVDLIVSQVYGAMSMSLITYSGQNFGAGRIDRVNMGLKRGILLVTLYNVIIVPVVYIFSKQIVGIFVKEAEVIEIGTQALHLTSLFYFALAIIYIPRGILNGCGDAKFSLINGITEVACRIIFSFLLMVVFKAGVWSVWWSACFTWTTVAIVCLHRYFQGKWKGKLT